MGRSRPFTNPVEAQGILDDRRREILALGYEALCARIGPVRTRFWGLIQIGGDRGQFDEIVADSGRRYFLEWSVNWDDRPMPGGDLRLLFELFEGDEENCPRMTDDEIVSLPGSS